MKPFIITEDDRMMQTMADDERTQIENAIALQEYLRQLAIHSPHGFEAFVLKHGRKFVRDCTTATIYRGKMKECFANAYRLVDRSPALFYCEGYANSGILPVLHGWACDASGKVYEPTWPEETGAYYGITFSRSFVYATAARRGMYGIIDDPENHFPLLRGDTTPDKWLQELKP